MFTFHDYSFNPLSIYVMLLILQPFNLHLLLFYFFSCRSQMTSWLSTLFPVSFGILLPFVTFLLTTKYTRCNNALDIVLHYMELFLTSFLSLKMSCFVKLQYFLQNTLHLQTIILNYHPSKSKSPAWKVFRHCQTSKHANGHIKCHYSHWN